MSAVELVPLSGAAERATTEEAASSGAEEKPSLPPLHP